MLALIPPFVWGVASIFDKVLVSRFIKDGLGAGIATNLASGLLPVLLIPFFVLEKLEPSIIVIVVASGIMWGLARLFYCLAIAKEEASRVVPFLQISPVLILIISTIFLGERLHILQIVGFLLVLTGALWVSVRKVKKSFHFSAALPHLIGNNICLTIAVLILKGASATSWWSALVWLNVGFALSTLPWLAISKSRIALRTGLARPAAWFVLAGIALLTFVGRATFFGALKGAPAAIVTVISATQTLFVLLFAAGMTLFLPHVLSEELSVKVIVSKGAAIALIMLGIAVLVVA